MEELKSRLSTFLTEVDENSRGKLTCDFYLDQWLAAHKWNVQKTESSLRRVFKWRKDSGVFKTDEFDPSFAVLFPVHINIQAKTGAPVGLIPAGDYKVRNVLESENGFSSFVHHCALITAKVEDAWLAHNLRILKEHEERQENPPAAEGLTFIVDLLNLEISQVTTKTLAAGVAIFKNVANYFPPMIDNIIYVNMPKPFVLVFKIFLKPFLTFANIHLLDGDQEKWILVLLKFMEAHQIPFEYGGERILEKSALNIFSNGVKQ